MALMLPLRARREPAVRPAAVPRRRRADAGPRRTLARRRHAGRAVAVGLAQPGRGAQRLAAGRALQARACFGGVPTVLAAASERADRRRRRLEHPAACSAGGSAIPVPVGRAYERALQVPVLEVYGMTETSSVHTIAYRDRPVRLGSVGHALPYSRVRVVQVDGEGRFSATARSTRSASSRCTAPACSPAT